MTAPVHKIACASCYTVGIPDASWRPRAHDEALVCGKCAPAHARPGVAVTPIASAEEIAAATKHFHAVPHTPAAALEREKAIQLLRRAGKLPRV